MREAPINSIGVPKPFQVRIFATMNVPGFLASTLGTGMLLLLPTSRGVRWIGMLLGVAALLLTAQRAALGALVATVLLMALVTHDRATRRSIGKMAITVAVVCAVLLSVPGAASRLTSTVNSVSQLNQNNSAELRWQQYVDLLPMLDANKLGRGLDWSNNNLYANVGEGIGLDSGMIDIFVSLGLPGSMLFLAALGVLVVQGLRVCRRIKDSAAAAEFSAVAFGLLQLPFGSQHTQEVGILLYLSLSLLLARAMSLGPVGGTKIIDKRETTVHSSSRHPSVAVRPL